MNNQEDLSNRKSDHLILAEKSQVLGPEKDCRFDYEPLFGKHPQNNLKNTSFEFLGKKMRAPIWISSMTGGTGDARKINQNLARAASQFGLGIGLGSCRPLLNSLKDISDFQLRPLLGRDVPFYANLGIAQIEELIEKKELQKIIDIVGLLEVDGLIVHINPLQEWNQPEGDRFKRTPLETIETLCEQSSLSLIVKEVGQGMGPKSLRALMELPLMAIEFGAFGGTNFSYLEALRSSNHIDSSPFVLAKIGHTAIEMVHEVNSILDGPIEKIRCRNFIISGGVKNSLDGYYLVNSCSGNAIYGQAKEFLKNAQDSYEDLEHFVRKEIQNWEMAEQFLRIRE